MSYTGRIILVYIFTYVTCNTTRKYISMWFDRPTTNRIYSGEQKVNFESPVPFSKCLRAKIYCAMNVHFDPQGCHTLLLKESELFLLSLGSWTIVFLLKKRMIFGQFFLFPPFLELLNDPRIFHCESLYLQASPHTFS